MAKRRGPTGAGAWKSAANKANPSSTSAWQSAANKAQQKAPAKPAAWRNAASGAQRNAPARPARPAPTPAPSGGGGGGSNARSFIPSYNSAPIGGGGGGGGGGGAYSGSNTAEVAAPAPPPPFDANSDESYLAQVSALTRALSDFEGQTTLDKTRYNTDYTQAIGNLGWKSAATGAVDDPNTKFVNESQGSWDTEDRTKASGRAYQSQMNDFASRGVLQSTMYAQAYDDLMKSLGDQRTGIDLAKTNFDTDKDRSLTNRKTETEDQKKMAYRDAADRYAAKYGTL